MSFFCKLLLSIVSLWDIATCYPGEVIYSCYNNVPQIHLSFDDAITFPQTENILNVLKQFNLTATFYVLTSLITPQNYADTQTIIERMKNEGHLIGNHGHNHYNLIHLNETEMKYEIDTSTAILTELLGYKPSTFRPPYGGISENIKHYLKINGYTIVLWDVGNVDWYYNNSILSNQAYCSMVPSMGGIFVFHNDYQGIDDANGLTQLIKILNTDYAEANFTPPFIVPNSPYFPYVSLLQCINRTNINHIPSHYIINNQNNAINVNIFIVSIIITAVIAFVFGYYLRSKYKLVTKIALLCCSNTNWCFRNGKKNGKQYDELRPLTKL